MTLLRRGTANKVSRRVGQTTAVTGHVSRPWHLSSQLNCGSCRCPGRLSGKKHRSPVDWGFDIPSHLDKSTEHLLRASRTLPAIAQPSSRRRAQRSSLLSSRSAPLSCGHSGSPGMHGAAAASWESNAPAWSAGGTSPLLGGTRGNGRQARSPSWVPVTPRSVRANREEELAGDRESQRAGRSAPPGGVGVGLATVISLARLSSSPSCAQTGWGGPVYTRAPGAQPRLLQTECLCPPKVTC